MPKNFDFHPWQSKSVAEDFIRQEASASLEMNNSVPVDTLDEMAAELKFRVQRDQKFRIDRANGVFSRLRPKS